MNPEYSQNKNSSKQNLNVDCCKVKYTIETWIFEVGFFI